MFQHTVGETYFLLLLTTLYDLLQSIAQCGVTSSPRVPERVAKVLESAVYDTSSQRPSGTAHWSLVLLLVSCTYCSVGSPDQVRYVRYELWGRAGAAAERISLLFPLWNTVNKCCSARPHQQHGGEEVRRHAAVLHAPHMALLVSNTPTQYLRCEWVEKCAGFKS